MKPPVVRTTPPRARIVRSSPKLSATARAALTQVRPLAEDICRLYRLLESKRPVRVCSDERVEPDYFIGIQHLQRLIHVLDRRGISVKDPKRGLLDFPARRDGRVVSLCWKVGESSLEFWHEEGAGFSGRQRVDDDGPWEEA